MGVVQEINSFWIKDFKARNINKWMILIVRWLDGHFDQARISTWANIDKQIFLPFFTVGRETVGRMHGTLILDWSGFYDKRKKIWFWDHLYAFYAASSKLLPLLSRIWILLESCCHFLPTLDLFCASTLPSSRNKDVPLKEMIIHMHALM